MTVNRLADYLDHMRQAIADFKAEAIKARRAGPATR